MVLDTIVDRFRFYAEMHKALRHDDSDKKKHAFFHIDVQEFQQSAPSGISKACLWLQTPEVEKTGAYDGMSEGFDFTFVVLVPKGNKNKVQMIRECKAISDQIVNMIMADVEVGLLPSFVPGTNEGIVGPIIDQLYGWGVSMGIEDGYDGTVDPQQWLHLSPDPEGQP